MKANKVVYFIVVTYNNKDLVDVCIESLDAQTYPNKHIVVVDNGSSDGTADYISQNYPHVHLIDAKENLGFAKANNIGIGYAKKDDSCGYVALINSDATIDKNWTETLVSFGDQKPKSACFQTPTLDYYDHSLLDSRGIKVDRLGRAVQLGYREKYQQRPNHVVFGVNAAACLIRIDFLTSQSFHDYFDEDMWMYLEDVDLAARSTMMGWKNWYVNGAFAYHMGSASSGKNPGFSVFFVYRNNLSMLVKNFPVIVLVNALIGIVITDLSTILRLARHKNVIALKAILKGRFVSIKTLPIYLKKRRSVLQNKKISLRELKLLMNAK